MVTVEPEETEPEETEPEATEPEATEPEATELAATELAATEPEGSKIIVDAYEAKIAKITESYEKRINEQNEIIKQLINGEALESTETIADRVNRKRNIKIW